MISGGEFYTVSKPVIGTIVTGVVGFRFRQNFFGRQILQIGETCQNWDTNTGYEDGQTYTRWRDATREEADDLVKGKYKFDMEQ